MLSLSKQLHFIQPGILLTVLRIIAVHGLAAHAEWTWVQVYATDVKGDAQNYIDEERHLLRGLLKSKCPTARILSFVDDSTYLGKESVLKTTEEIGKCLLKEIKAKRRRPVRT